MNKLFKSIIDFCFHPKTVYNEWFDFKNFHVNIKIQPKKYIKDYKEICDLVDNFNYEKARFELKKAKEKWGIFEFLHIENTLLLKEEQE